MYNYLFQDDKRGNNFVVLADNYREAAFMAYFICRSYSYLGEISDCQLDHMIVDLYIC